MIRLTLSYLRESMQAYRDILLNAVGLIRRSKLNFTTGLYAVDNPTTASTDVSVVGGLTPTAELEASATVQPGSYATFNVASSAVATLADGTAEGQRITVVRISDSTADVTFAGDINGTAPALGSSGVDGVTFYWEIPAEGPGRWVMESTLVTDPGSAGGGLTVSTVSGTSYTTVLGDANTVLETSNGSNVNITIPPNSSVAYPVGTKLTIIRGGAGGVSLVAGSGVTLTVAFEVYASPPVIRAQYGVVELIKTATNTWRVYGDLTIFS
jgi:hypothetical protein